MIIVILQMMYFSADNNAIRSKRFMDCYRKGLEGQQAEFAVKKYKSHRTVPEMIFE